MLTMIFLAALSIAVLVLSISLFQINKAIVNLEERVTKINNIYCTKIIDIDKKIKIISNKKW